MNVDAIMETMQRVPTGIFVLIAFMSLSGALLVCHILRVGVFTTLASVPVLLVAGLFGNALLMVNNIMLSTDKASNAALSASFGFILIATLTLLTLRIWALLRDKR